MMAPCADTILTPLLGRTTAVISRTSTYISRVLIKSTTRDANPHQASAFLEMGGLRQMEQVKWAKMRAETASVQSERQLFDLPSRTRDVVVRSVDDAHSCDRWLLQLQGQLQESGKRHNANWRGRPTLWSISKSGEAHDEFDFQNQSKSSYT